MATDPFRIKRVTTKLEQAWAASPQLNLGQLIEAIECLAWDHYYRAYPTRHFSMRLAALDDATFEAGLNDWIAGKRGEMGVVKAPTL